ncbi:MAG: AI-2E family transporter [Acidimicrobiia bacterium]|nr:AI-2E family transporter [Acidimicrobiia bacterium]
MTDEQPPPVGPVQAVRRELADTANGRPTLGALLTRAGVAGWSIIGLLIAAYLLLIVLRWFEVLLAPVVFAVVLIYLLNPIVNWLHHRRVHRILGSLAAFLVLAGFIVILGFLVVPSVADQAGALADDFPVIYEDSAAEIEGLIADLGFGDVDLWSYEQVEDFLNDPDNQDQIISTALDNLGAITSGLFEAVLVFLVAPVVAFYVLIDLPRIRKETVDMIPERLRAETLHVTRSLGAAVGGFLRGQVLVALIVGVLTSLGFRIIGLEFWLIIGLIAGFLNIIPFVGPWVGGGLGVTVALVVNGEVTTAIAAAVVAFAVQQIDNNFISPAVLRATVSLHPAVVLLVLILGGAVGGVWGVILVVPVTASVKILAGHYWRTRVLGQSWEEAQDALIKPSLPRRALWKAEDLLHIEHDHGKASTEEPEAGGVALDTQDDTEATDNGGNGQPGDDAPSTV